MFGLRVDHLLDVLPGQLAMPFSPRSSRNRSKMRRRVNRVVSARQANAREPKYPVTAAATVPGRDWRTPTGVRSPAFATSYASMNSEDHGKPGRGVSLKPGRLK